MIIYTLPLAMALAIVELPAAPSVCSTSTLECLLPLLPIFSLYYIDLAKIIILRLQVLSQR